ncbi:MAG: antitoxin [Kiritimatiellae bacterium]|jgi:plasmid stability protein|nr:antitoxin [Kiritimatiellia bacterium]
MAVLQVRGIDDQLYSALGALATRENRSISQEVITIIQSYLSSAKTLDKQSTDAFLDLAGSWKDNRSAKEISDDLRKSRRNSKRFQGDNDVFA